MTDQLRDLFREEADRIEVPHPPTTAILRDGRRRRGVRRTRGLVAVVATLAVVAGGVVGVGRLLDDHRTVSPAPSPGPATGGPAPTEDPPPSVTPTARPLVVSGSRVGGSALGTDADTVLADLTSRLGDPDLTVGPQRYVRIAGSQGWFADGSDPLSASWQHRTTSVACWGALCVTFGGADTDSLLLRGWELSEVNRWADYERVEDPRSPDVRLAGSGLGLGDSWKKLHAAYPGTGIGGGEGSSVVVQGTPWAGVSDGVGAWRLSGAWDYTRPGRAPVGAVVTRLSGGEGPELGCC